ncbi:hypothetical protein [Bradyrhizobium sp.]|uniref:hypothetical protein n=1 Tax=Bradyrhizobium sp. TaxID=376 RepID=UPI00273684B6|nr:hypothetical protein [Bradyrhizobium sp.]MDP3078704.1 hypothetical protein [Bradyrhizobium sp.]
MTPVRPKAPPSAIVLGVVTLAFLLNYALVYLGARPLIYCGLREPLWAMFQPLQIWIVLIGMVAFAWGVVTKRLSIWGVSLFLIFGAYILPEWSRILFSLGKDCGA